MSKDWQVTKENAKRTVKVSSQTGQTGRIRKRSNNTYDLCDLYDLHDIYDLFDQQFFNHFRIILMFELMNPLCK